MADDSIIFHGLSIGYLESDYTNVGTNIPKYPTFYGVTIEVPDISFVDIPEATPTSKKVYLTNKGNIMINPNDTILIEI
jgi:hypothetical protein